MARPGLRLKPRSRSLLSVENVLGVARVVLQLPSDDATGAAVTDVDPVFRQAADRSIRAVVVAAAETAQIDGRAVVVADDSVAGLGQAEERIGIEPHVAAAGAAEVGPEQERSVEARVPQLRGGEVRAAEIRFIELCADHC